MKKSSCYFGLILLVCSLKGYAKDMPDESIDWTSNSKALYSLLLAELEQSQANYGDSLDVVINEAKKQNTAELYRKAYYLAIRSEHYQKAVDMAKLWQKVNKNSKDNSASYSLLYAYILSGDLEQVYQSKDDKTLNEDSIPFWINLVNTQWENPNVLPFIAWLYETYPDNLKITHYYAKLLGTFGQPEKAIKILNQIKQEGLNITPAVQKAYIYFTNIEFEKGEQVYLKLLKDYPNNNSVHRVYASYLIELRRYQDVIKILKQMHDMTPKQENRTVLSLLYSYIRLSDEQAIDALIKSYLQKNERQSFQIYQFVASLYLEDNQDARAKYFYNKMLALKDKTEEENLLTKESLLLLDYKKSLELGNKNFDHFVSEFDLDEPNAKQLKLDLLMQSEHYEQAYQILSNQIKKEPKNTMYLYQRGLLAYEMGNLDQSLLDLKKISALDPKNASFQNALGYTLLSDPDHIKEAFSLIKKASFDLYDDPATVDSIGWAYYKIGEYQKALPYMRFAFSGLSFDEPEIVTHYILTLYSAGQKDKAKALYQLYKEDFSDDKYFNEQLLPLKEKLSEPKKS